MKATLSALALLLSLVTPAYAQIDLSKAGNVPVSGKASDPEAMIAIERANETLNDTNASLKQAIASMDDAAEAPR